jgi:hypothetical protein
MPQTQTNAPVAPVVDDLDTGMKVLIFLGNFCITPIIGIVLYFMWKDTKPNSAKQVCTLTWIPVAIGVVIGICFALFSVFIAASTK